MAEETEKPKAASSPSDQNLVVALRVRPMNEDEIIQGATPIAHKVDNNLVVLMDPMEDPDDILRANRSREKKYVYDRAFDGSTTQAEVYESTCKVLIPSVISGFNATVFAYGATGAGKTYTMLGSPDDPGIMARALNDLFLEMDKTHEDMTYKVAMSYLEIYNEMIRDLLNPGAGYLELREDSKGVQVSGLSEVTAKSTREVIGMLIRGNKERTQEPTAANKASSRSHAILQVTVRQRNKVRNTVQQVRVGKLFLIDLAGSERAANTQNRGKRMLEGAHINRSLLALGNCINALSDKSSQRYVNYRDSKLTRLLKDALGGNCKTVMIAHISPASIHFEESRNTLVYADRAKHIKTKVRRNVIDVSYHIAQYTNIISELREEVKRLKTKLDEQQQSKSIQAIQAGMLHAAGKEEQVHLNRLKDQLLGVFQDQMNLRRTLMELNNNAMEISLETTRHQLMIKEYEREKLAKKQEAQEAEAEDNKLKEEANSNEKAFLTETPEEAEPDDVKTAREELKGLEEETQHTQRLKVKCQKELDNARERAAKLEEVIPTKIKSDEQLEIWRLLCKVHELEIENLEMQSSCLLRNFEIRKQGMIIAKYEQHRSLCDEIIQQQRALLDERKLNCPQELEDLYDMYMQETRDMEENVPTLDTEQDNDRAGLAPHKFPSVTSINKRFLEAESISEQDKFSDAPTFRSGGANSVARKQLKKRSGNNINMLPKYEETPKEALFSQSPKAKEIRAAQRKEVAASLGGMGSPAQMAPLTVAKRQSSVVTLNSSRSSTNRSPSPPVITTRLASDKDLKRPGASSKEDRAMIMTSTRNIAALAARKRTKATLDAFNNDAAFNRTYTSLNTHSEQIDRTDRSDRRRDKDSYLTPSRLAIHDKTYDRSSVLLKHDDAISVGTGDPHSDILHDRQPLRPGLTRLQKNTKNEATKKRTKSHDYANYNQMTPEAFFRQLAKSSPRRKPVKKVGARGSQNGGITGRTTRRSRLPGPIPQDKASRALVPAGVDLSTYDDDIREFETAQTPPTTVYQSGADRGRGLSLQRKVRVPGFSDSSSSSTPQGNSSRTSKKQAATIPNYRKGDLTVAGFSLQR